MSVVSLPVTRPIGRALVVANPAGRTVLVQVLTRVGYDCSECDDPYTATLELSKHRLGYRALILSLASLFREELNLIQTVKRRFPHMEIWLAHTDGRPGALAESMRIGADGLLDEEGFHRIGPANPAQQFVAAPLPPADAEQESLPQEEFQPAEVGNEMGIGEPVLTAEELRALLQDQPQMPPSGAGNDD